VTADGRPPGADIVDVLVAVHIICVGTLDIFKDDGTTTDGLEARTGEETPPGIKSKASLKIRSELVVVKEVVAAALVVTFLRTAERTVFLAPILDPRRDALAERAGAEVAAKDAIFKIC